MGNKKRLVWVTDIHLNFLSDSDIQAFLNRIIAAEPDVLMIGGDIGEADSLARYLKGIADSLKKPIYFVLGNHDYYRGSIASVQWNVRQLCITAPNLTCLDDTGMISLTPQTALVGHGAWGDARYGDPLNALVLNDDVLIQDLAFLPIPQRNKRLNQLGDEAAQHLKRLLPAAFKSHQHVFVLLHVPPFKETCWTNGGISSDDGLPRFACKAVGDILYETMQAHPHHQMTVLCGHTHSGGEINILPNLYVISGGVEYGRPHIQRIFEVD